MLAEGNCLGMQLESYWIAMKKTGIRLETLSTMFLATGGFVGYFPVASGTMGTLVGVAIVYGLRGLPGFSFVLVTLVLGAAGVWASREANIIFNKADSSRIVIDEIVGFMITMIGIPVTGYWLVMAFLLFRFFDITKLPPANIIDSKMKNGWGVMLDDVVAGIYGNIILHLMLRAQL
jgi:phosphatidylglycerophosphatase A